MGPPAAPKDLRPQPSSGVAKGPQGQLRKERRSRASSEPFLRGTLIQRCLGSKLLSGNERANPSAADLPATNPRVSPRSRLAMLLGSS